ncbi:MAG: type II toxin-antitoxin system HicB family antitoxin [Rhizomicrobium sp.]|jgi:predicted RNase H-like HicB family nuclease
MPGLIYPAVLERGAKNTFGAWFPDFPDCVAGGTSPEQAIEKAQHVLAQAVYERAEKDRPLPEPTAFGAIELPKGCHFVAFFAVSVEAPDPSERVNVYLPKSLITRADKRAAELGMSRSSFFGLALSTTLGVFGKTGVVVPSSRRAQVLLAAATKPPEKPRKR